MARTSPRRPADRAARVAASGATGAVLCGGASRRMGRDKALLELGGEALVDRAARVLAEVTGRVVLATGSEDRYADRGLERVLDAVPGAGPLAGLEAALAATGGEWLVALACDMPGVEPDHLSALLEEARARDLDVCLLETERGVEPLLGVYRRTCLAPVRAAIARGERRLVAFHGDRGPGGRPLRVGTLPAPPGATGAARNLNTPDDWESERRRGAVEDRT